jgi:hypothetical protein
MEMRRAMWVRPRSRRRRWSPPPTAGQHATARVSPALAHQTPQPGTAQSSNAVEPPLPSGPRTSPPSTSSTRRRSSVLHSSNAAHSAARTLARLGGPEVATNAYTIPHHQTITAKEKPDRCYAQLGAPRAGFKLGSAHRLKPEWQSLRDVRSDSRAAVAIEYSDTLHRPRRHSAAASAATAITAATPSGEYILVLCARQLRPSVLEQLPLARHHSSSGGRAPGAECGRAAPQRCPAARHQTGAGCLSSLQPSNWRAAVCPVGRGCGHRLGGFRLG